jgi:hypothetical protein
VRGRILQLPGKYFQPSQTFSGKAGAYPSESPFLNLCPGPKDSAADPPPSARQQRQRDRTRQQGLTSGHQGPIL